VSQIFDQVPAFHSYASCCAQALPDPISMANIAMQLSDDDDLSTGLVLASSKKPSNFSLVKDYIGMLSSADNPTPAGRAASFVSLAGSKVQVEFEMICRRLRRRVLEAVTRERHGDDGVRILRLLLDTGKMDEKQVGVYFMLSLAGRSFIGSRTTGIESRYDGSQGCAAITIGHVRRVVNQHPRGPEECRSQSYSHLLSLVSAEDSSTFFCSPPCLGGLIYRRRIPYC
jgi:hypothetical protein